MTKVPLYARDEVTNRFNSRVVTKLVKNFRSHKDILRLPNDKFYESELQTCAPKTNSDTALRWKRLPNPQFPIIFHSCYTVEKRENNSPR